MPFQECSQMEHRLTFCAAASAPGANIRALCRAIPISPTTGYKWLARYRADGVAGLVPQSHRPHTSPTRTPPAVEAAVIALRAEHPAWGGRKLRVRLAQTHPELTPRPSASTITAILARHGLLDPVEAAKHRPYTRFEAAAPNDLWQMDFKGDFAVGAGRCYPLTILDDHSRFALRVAACADQQTATVQAQLTAVFRTYGLPARILTDNGSPWGDSGGEGWTPLRVWLLERGVQLRHGRPYHPQTQGKDERFHRTLAAEALRGQTFTDLADCQRAFEAFRATYNHLRPHEALAMATPASRYQPSARPFPEPVPPVGYAPDLLVRKVQAQGEISFRNHDLHVGRAFRGYPVALHPTADPVIWEVYFGEQHIRTLDLRPASR
jgi:transposase InsO family protein